MGLVGAMALMAGVVAVADQFSGHSLGFINPLYYRMLGTPALHDITAPKKPQAEVRTDFANFLNGSQGKLYRLQTIDVQSSTLHDTPGYDDETGVGTPTARRSSTRPRPRPDGDPGPQALTNGPGAGRTPAPGPRMLLSISRFHPVLRM